jgi:nucleoside-diphosphate-sugar epimerase
MKKTALVLGAGGFIGNHLVNYLKEAGYWVRGADIKLNEYQETKADDFILGDLTNHTNADTALKLQDNASFDEVYQLAADMGGAGYIFSGANDANVMHNSATINLNVANLSVKYKVKKIFYSSSACIYPEHNQLDPSNPNCEESSAYPANPDSEYGWEKLFSERLYFAYNRNYNLDVRVARFHNVFGPLGSWNNGKEKSPAAICRKVAEAPDGGEIEIWGDGEQTRSFLYIDECIEAVARLMKSNFLGPVNIGSNEMVTINRLADIACEVAGKSVTKKHIPGPLGVRGRNSDNNLIKEKLCWTPNTRLKDGIAKTYNWIAEQLKNQTNNLNQ